jgi:hypothetical protein
MGILKIREAVMDAKLVYSEPTPGQRITELHCWVATYQDGSEGIIAGGLEGLGMTPLLSSRRETAEKLEAKAREAMQLTKGQVVSVRLVTFKAE